MHVQYGICCIILLSYPLIISLTSPFYIFSPVPVQDLLSPAADIVILVADNKVHDD